MRSHLSIALIFIAATGCGPDESISGYANRAATYRLISINDAPFSASATIAFPQNGQVRGTGPCNQFQAEQLAPYPWFALGPIAATRAACPDLGQEQRYFAALSRMTIAEVSDPILLLTNEDGEVLTFQSD